MNRATNRTCRILIFTLMLFGANLLAKPAGMQNVTIKALSRKMSRAEILKTLGANVLTDSTLQSEKHHPFPLLLFEPVMFEGVSSLVEVVLADDSTSKIRVYLPYIGRESTRLKFPFELKSFVQSTSEDFNQMERKIEDELGIPTVLTGANFEYMNGTMQNIFAVFENGETRITIIPS
jgi:hypothetical protein